MIKMADKRGLYRMLRADFLIRYSVFAPLLTNCVAWGEIVHLAEVSSICKI